MARAAGRQSCAPCAMHAPCSGSGCAVHGFWSALDIAFGLLILIFLTRQRCEREQWSELKSREKPIGLVSLALGTGSVDGERRKIPIRIFERTERTPCLPSVIIYRYFFYTLHQKCSSITLSEPPVLLRAAPHYALPSFFRCGAR